MQKKHYKEVKDLEIIQEIPDVFTFQDGRRVADEDAWKERAAEIKSLYEYYMYGPLPDASKEKVTYQLGELQEKEETITLPNKEQYTIKVRTAPLRIEIECEGRKDGFETILCLPAERPIEGGYPVYLEMSFVWEGKELTASANDYYAAMRGYASICWNPCSVAADNSSRSGAFYTVHPYGTDWKEQTGVLAVWGWAASKVLDVLAQGLGEKLQINRENNILSGVSRYGKAALVAGAYDERIKVVVPACSGAGGASLYRYKSEGRTYDLSSLGHINEQGTATHLTTTNEALSNLQSDYSKHWFNDKFLEFDCPQRLPVDQHHLATLVADKERYLFFISGILGEDWVNPAAAGLNFAATRQVFRFLGIEEHVCICEHLQGHAVLLSDMIKLLDYCDVMLYHKEKTDVESDLQNLYTSVFWEESNLDETWHCFLCV